MGQVRSMLRCIAYDRRESPAQVLTRVDEVLTGLHVDTLTTVLLARIEPPAEHAPGPRTLRWSSAGHLPPLLAHADGAVHVLGSHPPERLLGTDSPGARSNHETPLNPGDTVLFYTDGLVEYGHRDLDGGIAELAAALGRMATLPVDELCDRLLEGLAPGRTDDDIAMLAVHLHRGPRI